MAADGDNLLDLLNSSSSFNLNVFGICEKNLCCRSCRVNVLDKFETLSPPQNDEMDVLVDLGNKFKEGSTRMSCQVNLKSQNEGLVVEIP